MRMADLLQQVTTTMAQLHHLGTSRAGSPQATDHIPAPAPISAPISVPVAASAPPLSKVVNAVAAVATGGGGEASHVDDTAGAARQKQVRISEAGDDDDDSENDESEDEALPPTWGSSKGGGERKLVPRPGVQADIEAAVEGRPKPKPQPPLMMVPSNAPREKAPSLLPAEEALGALGSPVTQLQARLSQAKQNFRSLREKRL
jgi:hypothetical protein